MNTSTARKRTSENEQRIASTLNTKMEKRVSETYRPMFLKLWVQVYHIIYDQYFIIDLSFLNTFF